MCLWKRNIVTPSTYGRSFQCQNFVAVRGKAGPKRFLPQEGMDDVALFAKSQEQAAFFCLINFKRNYVNSWL